VIILFSCCSALYALFFSFVAYSGLNVNPVENIISLNIHQMKDGEVSLDKEELEEIEKGYLIKNVQ
jgi:hypothetical protein